MCSDEISERPVCGSSLVDGYKLTDGVKGMNSKRFARLIINQPAVNLPIHKLNNGSFTMVGGPWLTLRLTK